MNTIIIRMATDQDSENITSLLFEAFKEFEHLYSKEAFAATVISPAEVSRRMQEGPLWVAELDGKILGTVSLLPRDNEAYVRGMAVLPAAQGLKIGLKLMQQAEQFGLENHFSRLFLRTTPYLHKAIKLYEQFGFVVLGEREEDFFGTPSFLMEKNLSRAL